MALEDESLLTDTDRPNLFALVGTLFSAASLMMLGCGCIPITGVIFIPFGGILSSMGLLATWAGHGVARQTGRGGDLVQWGVIIGGFTLLAWTSMGVLLLITSLAFSMSYP